MSTLHSCDGKVPQGEEDIVHGIVKVIQINTYTKCHAVTGDKNQENTSEY